MVTISDPILAVFSAHAEVVPLDPDKDVPYGRILRARGGSSEKFPLPDVRYQYSPRTRR